MKTAAEQKLFKALMSGNGLLSAIQEWDSERKRIANANRKTPPSRAKLKNIK
jgi:hypothetical protein